MRMLVEGHSDAASAKRMGVKGEDTIYSTEDLAKGDVMFAATGVTDGTMLKGVRRFHGGATTHSMVMRSKSGTVRVIEATHTCMTIRGAKKSGAVMVTSALRGIFRENESFGLLSHDEWKGVFTKRSTHAESSRSTWRPSTVVTVTACRATCAPCRKRWVGGC